MSISFKGKQTTTVDAKGRVVLASKYRNQIKAKDGEEVELVAYFDEERGCIELYTPERFEEEFTDFLGKIPRYDVLYRRFLTKLGENTESTKMDNQGRIKLPGNLLEKANITREVVLVGALFKIEIWDPEVKKRYESGSDLTVGQMEKMIREKAESSAKIWQPHTGPAGSDRKIPDS